MAATLQSFAELPADFIYTTRPIRRSPGFALVAILSLAFGVGANTMVFSVVNALVLRPLPVAQPDQLVFVQRSGRSPGQYPNYRDLRDHTTLAGLIGYRVSPMDLELAFQSGTP